MYEAFYLDVPVVEYASYDKELCRRYGQTSSGGRCCDFFVVRDTKKLQTVLNGIMNGNTEYKIDRAFKDMIFNSKIDNLFGITDEHFIGK
jgi:hypothetical protein